MQWLSCDDIGHVNNVQGNVLQGNVLKVLHSASLFKSAVYSPGADLGAFRV